MREAVYNSAIPDGILNTVNRASRSLPRLCVLRSFFVIFAVCGATVVARAADWNGAEQQLAQKVAAITGPGAVALAVESRSSLAKRDSEAIQYGLRSALEGLGLRFVKPEQAAADVTISLSENAASYVWVAEIRQGAGEAAVVMVSLPRVENSIAARDAAPLSLRKISLWTEDDPILDVAVLEEGATPTHIAVLDSEGISFYRMQGGRWQREQALEILHARPWPRDLRGRLIPAKDHLLDAYLPGVVCSVPAGSPLTLNCRESDDPWPLNAALNGTSPSVFPGVSPSNNASAAVPQMKGFFAPTRNFFTGALTPGVGKFTTVPKFYSAAAVPRERYALWLFAAVDGRIHMVDGVSDQTATLGWGSDLASVRTACGAGWQVLATTAGEQAEDSLRAYEFPDRDPVAVSSATDFPGAITALWTEAKGDTVVVVARNRGTGSYEAFRTAITCNQ